MQNHSQQVQYHDWNTIFLCLIGASFMAVVTFLFVLNAAAPEQLVAERTEKETNAVSEEKK